MSGPSFSFLLLLEVKKLRNTSVGIFIAYLWFTDWSTFTLPSVGQTLKAHRCTLRRLQGKDAVLSWTHCYSTLTKNILWEVTFTDKTLKGTAPTVPQGMWKAYAWTEPRQQSATCLNYLALTPIELLFWDKLWHYALDPYWATLFFLTPLLHSLWRLYLETLLIILT